MKSKWSYISILLFFLLTLQIVSNGNGNVVASQNQSPTFNYFMYYSQINQSEVDGTIGNTEYPEANQILSVDGYNFADVSFVHNGSYMKIGIKAHNLFGWVGFGVGDNGMLNGTLITTGASGNTPVGASIWKGIGNEFPNFISSFENANASVAVNEDSEGTTVEFLLPLNLTSIGGYDWSVGGTYGFFLAAHKDSDALTYHTYHAPRNLKVTLLSQAVGLPQTVSISSFSASVLNGEVYLLTAKLSNAPTGTDVEFYMNTTFGGVLLGTNQTDSTGNVQLTANLSISTFEKATVWVKVNPQQGFTGAMATATISGLQAEFEDIYVHNIVADPEYDNKELFLINPNLLNNAGHLIGAVLIYGLMLIIVMLIWEYVAAIMKLAYISLVGKRMEAENE